MALVSLSNGWKASAEKLTSKLSEKVESFLRKQCVNIPFRHASGSMPLQSHSAGADLFIVTGCAGAGKSSFIKCITGEDVYVGSTLSSGKCDYPVRHAVLNMIRYNNNQSCPYGHRQQTVFVHGCAWI